MKALHWAIILVAIIVPISIVCRNLVNTRFSALKDEVRINNAIDTATKDAIDQIIAVSGFEYDNEFGDVINVTPALALESINTFFHTMAVNYNIPYKMSDTTTLDGDRTSSYIKNYFASYIPAVVVIAYDGFYIYSIDEDSSGGYYGYKLSSKIPYTFDAGDYTIGYTLGNDIYLYTHPSMDDNFEGKCYSGRISGDSIDEIISKYNEEFLSLGIEDPDSVAALTSDMSIIAYSLYSNNKIRSDMSYILPFDSSAEVGFLEDYKTDENGNTTIGAFHSNRRDIITKIISDSLTQEINEHNNYADMAGITYNFNLPTINQDDWYNAIDDITVMAFVQGIPIGTAKGTYFNSFALGGSQIVRAQYLYGKVYEESSVPLYHRRNCPLIADGSYENIFINREDAIKEGYYACQLCNK
ncbi:MAG: hypothetical protein IJ220_05010 [Clostridia bacterium]|nr:hypothetical protein [Clostridia bacterium]